MIRWPAIRARPGGAQSLRRWRVRRRERSGQCGVRSARFVKGELSRRNDLAPTADLRAAIKGGAIVGVSRQRAGEGDGWWGRSLGIRISLADHDVIVDGIEIAGAIGLLSP